MSDKTKIEWCDATWSPVSGCTKVSAGCANCYAEMMFTRFWGPRKADPSTWGKDAARFSQVVCHPGRLDQPLHWRKPRRVFVCSMGDLFHEDVPPEFVARVFAVMSAATQHTFMVLTKRPNRLAEWGRWFDGLQYSPHDQDAQTRIEVGPLPLPNVWLGVSDEGDRHERLDMLRQTPAALRFVSFEPLLCDPGIVDLSGIGWVICGGESGPGARPMHPDWPRSLRDQCQAAGVPFFFKHWGEWAPGWRAGEALAEGRTIPPGCKTHKWGDGESAHWSWRIGKKAAGRLLDGREWNGSRGAAQALKEKP